jgi:hypothetical protein
MSETDIDHRLPVPWESRVRQLLKGEISLEEATSLPGAGHTEGYDPEVFKADLKLLHKLNSMYMSTKSWRLIEFGMSILGGPGRILHLGGGYDWESYAAITENEGRLITPMELRTMLEEEELLGIDLHMEIGPLEPEGEGPGPPEVDVRPRADGGPTGIEAGADVPKAEVTGPKTRVRDDDEFGFRSLPPVTMEPDIGSKAMEELAQRFIPRSITDGEWMISTKTLILGRSAGYPYKKACEMVSEMRDEPTVLDAKDYCEFVRSKAEMYEVGRECRLQLSMELQTIDELLMRLERNRNEEERRVLAMEILDLPVKYHIVKGNRMYSMAYIEAYPDQFPIEEIAKFNTKVKCESDCLICPCFMHTLVKPRPRITKLD